MRLNRLKHIVILTAALLPTVPARADADARYLVEFIAGEGISYNEYRYRDLVLEPHEFPEFTHELGLNAFRFSVHDWLGLGMGAGVQYNLTGASSTYMDDPTIRFMFHWVKVPLLLSLALDRGTAIAHLDGGVYASLFLGGNREWEDERRDESRSGGLSYSDVSSDFGVRFQFCMDMEAAYTKGGKKAVGLGMGLFMEKSLIDVLKDNNEEFRAFRLGVIGIVSIAPSRR